MESAGSAHVQAPQQESMVQIGGVRDVMPDDVALTGLSIITIKSAALVHIPTINRAIGLCGTAIGSRHPTWRLEPVPGE